MPNKRITELSTTISSPRNGDVVEVDNATEGSAQISISSLIPPVPPTELPPSGNFLKFGGTFNHDGGLDIAVGAAEYYIQGVPYSSPAAIVTAAAADATHPRIDAVVLNTSGVATIVTGTPAASPVRPAIDPSTQLDLTFITIAALATEPEIDVEPLYLENTEWTFTPSAGSIDPDDTTGERSGTKAIKITAGAAGANFKLVNGSPYDIEAKSQLTMWINPVTWVSQKQLQIHCYLSNVAVGNIVTIRDGVFGFIRTTASYQLVAIPTSLFGLSGVVPDEVRFTIAGGGTALTCFIDDIALQGGYVPVVTKAMINPMTTAGDSIVGGTDGAPTRLPLGNALQVRRVNAAGTAEEFATPKADELQAGTYAADAGSNDTYVATLSPAITSYVTGAHYRFKANTANTGAATINFNGLGAKTIKKAAGGITTDLADNDIRAGQWVDLVYDGTNMQMQSLLGNAGSGDMLLGTAQTVTAAKTFNAGTLKIASGGDLVDANGNELFKFTATGSAVNELTLANAATGGNPNITASGGDTNIGLDFTVKGSGEFRVLGTGTNTIARVKSTSGAARLRVERPDVSKDCLFEFITADRSDVFYFGMENSANISGGNTMAFQYWTGSAVELHMTMNSSGQVAVEKTTASSSTTTGAFICKGGVGIAGAVFTGAAITTGAPSGGTAAAWKHGTVASVSPTAPNRTIEIDVNGTRYFLHAKTTND